MAKHLKYWVRKELMETDSGEIIDMSSKFYEECADKEALKTLAEMDHGHNYQSPTSNGHGVALNCLPVVVGTKWVISEDTFNEMLSCMPPMRRPGGGFRMSEGNCSGPNGGTIHSAYYVSNGVYWHEYEEV